MAWKLGDNSPFVPYFHASLTDSCANGLAAALSWQIASRSIGTIDASTSGEHTSVQSGYAIDGSRRKMSGGSMLPTSIPMLRTLSLKFWTEVSDP